MSKNYNFVQPYRAVSQIKGVDTLIAEIEFLYPFDVTGRHTDVINDVKITLLAINPVLIDIKISF